MKVKKGDKIIFKRNIDSMYRSDLNSLTDKVHVVLRTVEDEFCVRSVKHEQNTNHIYFEKNQIDERATLLYRDGKLKPAVLKKRLNVPRIVQFNEELEERIVDSILNNDLLSVKELLSTMLVYRGKLTPRMLYVLAILDRKYSDDDYIKRSVEKLLIALKKFKDIRCSRRYLNFKEDDVIVLFKSGLRTGKPELVECKVNMFSLSDSIQTKIGTSQWWASPNEIFIMGTDRLSLPIDDESTKLISEFKGGN